MKSKDDFLEKTKSGWEQYSGDLLTLEDAREILYNLHGFFSLLDKWDKESKKTTGSK